MHQEIVSRVETEALFDLCEWGEPDMSACGRDEDGVEEETHDGAGASAAVAGQVRAEGGVPVIRPGQLLLDA